MVPLLPASLADKVGGVVSLTTLLTEKLTAAELAELLAASKALAMRLCALFVNVVESSVME
jgi:hypothetical protein